LVALTVAVAAGWADDCLTVAVATGVAVGAAALVVMPMLASASTSRKKRAQPGNVLRRIWGTGLDGWCFIVEFSLRRD
jgi:hypothetical protein